MIQSFSPPFMVVSLYFLNSHFSRFTIRLQSHLSSSSFLSVINLQIHGHHHQQQLKQEFPPNQFQIFPQKQEREDCILEKTCLSIIKSCSTNTQFHQIHAHIIRTGLIQEHSILTNFLLLSALSPFSDMNYSRLIFTQIEKPTIFIWNTMIRGYSQSNSPEKAVFFYRFMRKQGVHPNVLSYSFVLKSCSRICSIFEGKQIHSRILQDGHDSDCFLLTSLMDLYSRCKNGDDACLLFEKMPQRDTVVWNVLISCYSQNNRTRDALSLFEEMQGPNGSQPDDVTCLLLLPACAHLGALDIGEQIHNYINQRGYDKAVNICNSLIDMYSKCGCLEKAYGVFEKMPVRSVVTWSAMISGLAMNSHGREAIEAFNAMQRMGVAPDDQTFTGILSACSHAGLVNEGCRYFELMRTKFGLVPNVHHYGCMVDLLGRAGLLDEAYQLVNSMTVEPDSTTWRTMLGACRIHGHAQLGERVIEHLTEMKSQQAGDYVLLLNTYASVGNWDGVAEVRKLMKDQKIQTTPGRSFIEVNGRIHEFVVDDDSHPREKEIYSMLDEIGRQLKIAGYVANMAAELHDLDVEEKENALSYHSEKLAIAFGLISTPPGTAIRITKNLRICIDCHTFAKVLSKVYNREIIIRDRSRFHHFRDRSCSCKDYW